MKTQREEFLQLRKEELLSFTVAVTIPLPLSLFLSLSLSLPCALQACVRIYASAERTGNSEY